MRFKEVRDFWKMSDFPFFHVFLQWFQTGESPWIFVFGVFLSRFTMVKTAIFEKKCYFFHKIHIVLGAVICITFWSFLALLWLTNFHFLINFFYIFGKITASSYGLKSQKFRFYTMKSHSKNTLFWPQKSHFLAIFGPK